MADDTQLVTGPDGNDYHFPAGTTKEQAIAYFKKKGIGAPPTHGAGGSFGPEGSPVARFLSGFGGQYQGALLAPMGIGSDVLPAAKLDKKGNLLPMSEQTPVETGQTFPGMFKEIKEFGQSLVPVNQFQEGDVAGAAGKTLANILMLKTAERFQKPTEAAKASPPPPSEGVVKPTVGRKVVQALTGTDWRATRDLAKKTVEANKEARAQAAEAKTAAETKAAEDTAKAQEKFTTRKAKVEADNLKKQTEHAEQVAEVEKLKRDAAEQGTRRGELARTVQKQGVRLVQRVKSARAKAKASFNVAYNDIRQRVGDESVPITELTDVVSAEKANLAGSRTKVAVFEDMLKRAQQENALSRAREEAMQSQGYPASQSFDDLPPDRQRMIDQIAASDPRIQAAEEGPPETLSFKDARGYESEIGRLLRNWSGDSDVEHALGKVRDQTRRISEQLANKKGVGPLLRRTNAAYRDFKETFDEPTGPSKSGSPLAQSLNAADPAYAVKPLTTPETSARVRNMLNRFDPPDASGQGGGAALYDNFLKSLREYEGLPKPEAIQKALATKAPKAPELKPVPEAPKPVSPDMTKVDDAIKKLKTLDLKDLEAKKLENYDKFVQRISHWGTWLIPILGMEVIRSVWLAEPATAMGVIRNVASFFIARQGLLGLLEKPEVAEWITRVPPKDLELLNRPEYRGVALETLKPIVEEAQRQGKPVSPALAAFVAASGPSGERKGVAAALTPPMGGKGQVEGMISPGNINLYNRPQIPNPKGGTSTVYSMSFEEDGKEILVPKAADGKIMSDNEAIDRYHKTGEHLGMFKDAASADAYAQQLHKDYESGKYGSTPATK